MIRLIVPLISYFGPFLMLGLILGVVMDNKGVALGCGVPLAVLYLLLSLTKYGRGYRKRARR